MAPRTYNIRVIYIRHKGKIFLLAFLLIILMWGLFTDWRFNGIWPRTERWFKTHISFLRDDKPKKYHGQIPIEPPLTKKGKKAKEAITKEIKYWKDKFFTDSTARADDGFYWSSKCDSLRDSLKNAKSGCKVVVADSAQTTKPQNATSQKHAKHHRRRLINKPINENNVNPFFRQRSGPPPCSCPH